MAQGDGKSAGVNANFGPKYEQHVAQMQKLLEEANAKIEALTKEGDELR
jgi:hypothetical protein